jgi:hypothetical protein
MLGRGKRTRQWERTRAILKPRFERAGITSCEFRYQGCWRGNALGFAHVDKRRFLAPGELEKVALACCVCHNKLDNEMTRNEMRREVERVIANRICQP